MKKKKWKIHKKMDKKCYQKDKKNLSIKKNENSRKKFNKFSFLYLTKKKVIKYEKLAPRRFRRIFP